MKMPFLGTSRPLFREEWLEYSKSERTKLLDDTTDIDGVQRELSVGANNGKKSKLRTLEEWVQRQFWDTPHCRWIDYLSLALLVLLAWLLLYCLFGNEVTPRGDLFRLLVLVLCAAVAGRLAVLVRLPPLLGMLLAGIALRTLGFYHVSGVYRTIVVNLRFLLCAVSPAVVVPALLDLQDRGYGVDKGVPTLVLAACSLDDITAISLFSLCLGMIFSTGDLTHQILQGPTDIGVGLIVGIAWGIVSGSLPHRYDALVVWKRAAMVGGGGLCAIAGAPLAGFPSAGPLACVTQAFVASICWKVHDPQPDKPQVADVFSVLWRVLEPMLYAFIGAEIDLTVLDPNTVLWGAAVILGALVVRVIVCSIVLLGGGLNWKEILFVSLAWLPKATVQAALAPLPLDMARRSHAPWEDLARAEDVLTVAVLSILLTSPLGAIGASLGGPRLLRRHSGATPT